MDSTAGWPKRDLAAARKDGVGHNYQMPFQKQQDFDSVLVPEAACKAIPCKAEGREAFVQLQECLLSSPRQLSSVRSRFLLLQEH